MTARYCCSPTAQGVRMPLTTRIHHMFRSGRWRNSTRNTNHQYIYLLHTVWKTRDSGIGVENSLREYCDDRVELQKRRQCVTKTASVAEVPAKRETETA